MRVEMHFKCVFFNLLLFFTGLPSQHIIYVRNIEEGLPLFLFNYSDRKIYGLYVAAGHGQLNIDPYAWTNGGSEKTPFAAQVIALLLEFYIHSFSG
jgi:Development and cell death domain